MSRDTTIYYGVTSKIETPECKILDTKTFKCPVCGSQMEFNNIDCDGVVKPYVSETMPWERKLNMGIRAWREENPCSLKCPKCDIIITNLKWVNMHWDEIVIKEENKSNMKENERD